MPDPATPHHAAPDLARIEAHYSAHGADIAARILAELPPGAAVTPDALAPFDHFHGRGLAATRELAAMLDPQQGERLVDLGCGIGGPARWFASHYGCHVTGIDLTKSYCEAARRLTATTGLSGQVEIHHGSALATPFAAAAFERAYSQNVIMNIADKAGFFREAFRVLKPGGVLAMSFIADGPNGPPYYPSMWATSAADSFLASAATTRQALEATGFAVERLDERVERPGPDIEAEIAEAERQAPAGAGIHVLVGDRFRERILNSLRSRRDLRVARIDLLARKPA